jgi:hypothetical protein
VVSRYVFCSPGEQRTLRYIYRQERKLGHIITSNPESFRGLNQQAIYYTPKAKENKQEWDYFIYSIIVPGQNMLIPFPFEQYTKLGRLLRGVE